MRKDRVKILALVCLVFYTAAPAAGQSGRKRPVPNAPAGQDDKDTVRLRAEEVLLPVSVRSQDGKLPTYLDRGDFIVTEDNKRQRITSVLRTPANILMILDTSGEVLSRKNTNLNRDLALKIIDSLGEGDQAAIITYADKVNLLAAWTGDKQQLRHALNWQFKPGLNSRFHDALLYAAEQVLPKVSGRRSLVLVTDGVDSFRSLAFEKALESLHRARATVYVASQNAILVSELRPRYFNPLTWYEMIDAKTRKRYEPLRRYVRDLEAAEVTLQSLAEETGGAMWNPLTWDRFKEVNLRLVEEIGTEYVIAYSSERPPEDVSFHPIRVVATRRDLVVRSRRGVYSNLPAGHH